MVEDSKRFEEEDKRAAQKTQAKNSFEGYVYGLRSSLNDSKLAGKIAAADKSKLETAINDSINGWITSK